MLVGLLSGHPAEPSGHETFSEIDCIRPAKGFFANDCESKPHSVVCKHPRHVLGPARQHDGHLAACLLRRRRDTPKVHSPGLGIETVFDEQAAVETVAQQDKNVTPSGPDEQREVRIGQPGGREVNKAARASQYGVQTVRELMPGNYPFREAGISEWFTIRVDQRVRYCQDYTLGTQRTEVREWPAECIEHEPVGSNAVNGGLGKRRWVQGL